MTDPVAAADGGRCRFKDLCIDVTTPAVMATFWAGALGLTAELLDTGAYRLVDDVAEHTVWLNRVPEPRTVKQRVHLDVAVTDIAELVELGARVADEQLRWTVLSDPEGGELCAFARPVEELARYRLTEIVVDARDPEAIASWWGDRLGGAPEPSEDRRFWWLPPTAGLPTTWVFRSVPEAKRVKNRIHWDVLGNSEGLVEVGSTLLRPAEIGRPWEVLADPEGNEYCVFPVHAALAL